MIEIVIDRNGGHGDGMVSGANDCKLMDFLSLSVVCSELGAKA